MKVYAKDFDGRLPLTGTRRTGVIRGETRYQLKNYPAGWADAIRPWGKSDTIFICYADPLPQNTWRNPALDKYTDFWMNRNVSGVRENEVSFPSATLLLGDGNDGLDKTDASYAKTALAAQWLTDESSPAYRHYGAANYLLMDGAVRWIKPQDVRTYGGRKNSFALR